MGSVISTTHPTEESSITLLGRMMKLGLCVAMALVLAFVSVVANPLKAEIGEGGPGEDHDLDSPRGGVASNVDSEEGGLEDRDNGCKKNYDCSILEYCNCSSGTCEFAGIPVRGNTCFLGFVVPERQVLDS